MPEQQSAVVVNNLYKSFRLPHERHSGIKQLIVQFFRRRRGYEVQHVLDDVSFEIKKGEFFGIVGRNGSGKSTLLKLLAGIYTPDKGTVQVHGSLTPFIELGVGFNPELTGRENVYMNGALLGFSRGEMDGMYEEIVEFAELERFMDQKLKNYSSGMQVRLAFSIAIKARSEILLIDEVLAVGDTAFQKKCYSYFDQLKREKRTVILVTHDMSAVERFCDRALFIEDGIIQLQGKPHKIAAAYSRSNDTSYENSLKNATSQDWPFQVSILDCSGEPTNSFDFNSRMRVAMKWQQKSVRYVGVAIFRENGEYVFGPNTYQDGHKLMDPYSADYEVLLNLNEGKYFLKAAIMGRNDQDIIEFIEEGPYFTVRRNYDGGYWGGVTKLDHDWR